VIAIIDYNMGNTLSLEKTLKRLGIACEITNDPENIQKASKLIIPGVGNFGFAMESLYCLNLVEILSELVLQQRKPVLGICLGMQIFGMKSAESDKPGLKWLNFESTPFDKENHEIKIPHVGWNTLTSKFNNPFIQLDESEFYFTHSYHAEGCSDDIILSTTEYGYTFTSAVWKNNIVGVQFHPEKSHTQGLAIIKNFLEYQFV
jgi:glutamine amidotransferase